MTVLRPSSTATTPEDRRDALAAPVADALWLLARQWQTGGFVADDAGSPIHVELAHVTAPLTLGGSEVAGPLEPAIEAEAAPAQPDAALRARLASELLRRLRDAGLPSERLTGLRARLAAAHPLNGGGPFAGRLPDGQALLSLRALPDVDPADARTVPPVFAAWREWARPLIGAGPGEAPAAWDAERLEYTATATAVLPEGPLALRLDGYDGNGLDWYSFDRVDAPAAGPASTPSTVEVRPAPVAYAGMPRPRFWELEDGHVNLDVLAGADPAHALLTLFAHAYANDWFLVPLELPPGVSRVARLDVTDTFGTRTTIASTASIEGAAGGWKAWELTGAADGLRVHLPIAPVPLEGPAIEDVLVARDEMANLAWIIELITRDGDGDAVDRYRRWIRLRSEADPAFDPTSRVTAGRYLLGTTIPDFWYPLMAAAGPGGRRRLQLAAVPPEATEVSDEGVQGRLIVHAPETVLADEEASRTGTRLQRVDRLTRTRAGRAVWRARMKRPGRGEASSGLRFDVLR